MHKGLKHYTRQRDRGCPKPSPNGPGPSPCPPRTGREKLQGHRPCIGVRALGGGGGCIETVTRSPGSACTCDTACSAVAPTMGRSMGCRTGMPARCWGRSAAGATVGRRPRCSGPSSRRARAGAGRASRDRGRGRGRSGAGASTQRCTTCLHVRHRVQRRRARHGRQRGVQRHVLEQPEEHLQGPRARGGAWRWGRAAHVQRGGRDGTATEQHLQGPRAHGRGRRRGAKGAGSDGWGREHRHLRARA
jgi:hypothetical protein